MMLKSEDDDGYCSRSSLDSPVHTIKIETISASSSSLDYKDEESTKQDRGSLASSATNFMEVMLITDEWKKSEASCHIKANALSVNTLLQNNQHKSITSEVDISSQILKERVSEKDFQPRRTIKLMPSSSQNLLLFTKQSALSGLVVSSKPTVSYNPVTLHSLIKNNNNILLGNQNAQLQASRRVVQGNNPPIKLTAAEVLKSKISHHAEVQKKIQSPIQTQCPKKVILAKDSNSQGLNSSFTSARTSQPYIKNSKGSGWGGRPSLYVGRHELHPVIDHDYCEFSAFNAEIQSGIILMSRETYARNDRMNMKRNKASLQSPLVSTAASSTPLSKGCIRSADVRPSPSQNPQISLSQSSENKRKCLKRKYVSPPLDAIPIVKNAVGRPRLSGKGEKSQVSGKKGNGYDSSEDLSSPPLTEDKNYVKIPGSFQNDFVYYATIRGRSSRKRQSENKQSLQSTSSSQQKNTSMSNINAFDWYKEMARTDKSIRFGLTGSPNENDKLTKCEEEKHLNKVDITSLFCSSYDEGKNLISESEVADLVMQMLPPTDVERNSLFHNHFLSSIPDSTCKMNSTDMMGCDNTQSLIDGIIDISSIDLNSMASELGSMLGSVQRQDIIQEQQGLNSIDFPAMTSSQLLEDICENDLLMSSDIANMNAFLNEFSDDQVDICSAVEDDGMLSSMMRSDVMGLLVSTEPKILEDELNQPICLTPPDSATISSNDSLSFPCDLKGFNFNNDDSHLSNSSHATSIQQTGDLLTPPPSLPPSSAPPELTTVNMFWNDLPGLLIEGREYVRLVDIHKQIMPAKDTGILKKRCIMLGLEVSSCSELQRDFLIRYMNAAKSKSKVIVTKDMALDLISFYINPKMRSELMCKDSKKEVKLCERWGLEKSEYVLKDLPSPSISSAPFKDRHSQQISSKNEGPASSPDSIKRSARLLNKRFSYLDLVNNGLPLSLKPLHSKNSLKHNSGKNVPIEDLQQQWLESLKNKFSQSTSCTNENESDSFIRYSQGLPEQFENPHWSKPDEDQSSTNIDCVMPHKNSQTSVVDTAKEGENGSSPVVTTNSNLCSEEMDSDLSSEISVDRVLDCAWVAPGMGEPKSHPDASAAGLPKADPGISKPSDLAGTAISAELGESISSCWKSERVLRSSTCFAKGIALDGRKRKLGAQCLTRVQKIPKLGGRQCYKSKSVPAIENRTPRLIRSKRHFLKPLSNSNYHKKQSHGFISKEGLFAGKTQDKSKTHSRPQRQARRKFNVLKF